MTRKEDIQRAIHEDIAKQNLVAKITPQPQIIIPESVQIENRKQEIERIRKYNEHREITLSWINKYGLYEAMQVLENETQAGSIRVSEGNYDPVKFAYTLPIRILQGRLRIPTGEVREDYTHYSLLGSPDIYGNMYKRYAKEEITKLSPVKQLENTLSMVITSSVGSDYLSVEYKTYDYRLIENHLFTGKVYKGDSDLQSETDFENKSYLHLPMNLEGIQENQKAIENFFVFGYRIIEQESKTLK
jgi:hypothetical protein